MNTTKNEDNQKRRRPEIKTTRNEDDRKRRLTKIKMTITKGRVTGATRLVKYCDHYF